MSAKNTEVRRNDIQRRALALDSLEQVVGGMDLSNERESENVEDRRMMGCWQCDPADSLYEQLNWVGLGA